MKNIIENIAQEQDVAWGIIAQKIDENFAEIEEKNRRCKLGIG